MTLAFASPAAAEWVRVDTPHFVVFGQAGEKSTRVIAVEFERFREAITRVMPVASGASPVPTLVVVFADRRSFSPFAPRFNGRPVQLDGYFQGTETDNTIALSLEQRESALRIVFHEYTHLVIAGATRALPAWLGEGLAEYYSTFQVRGDGRGAITGRAIPSHLQLLNTRTLLPLDELLSVERDSPLYNEGERRSVFYAQSWALTHMLMSGEPGRSEQLAQYVRLTAGGTPARDAWRQVFGTFDAIGLLKAYVRRDTMRGFSFRFDEQIKAASAVTSVASPSEVEAVLGMLLRNIDPGEAEARIRKAAGLAPPSPLARAMLGFLRADIGGDDAHQLLVPAAADRGDWLAQYYTAAGLAHLVAGSTRPDVPSIDAARSALGVVMRARPDLAHAHALTAYVADPEDAIASVARARALAPGRPDYAYLEARLHSNAGEFAAARGLLAPLLTAAYSEEVRNRARTLMTEVAAEEARVKPGGDVRVGGLTPGHTYFAYRTLRSGENRLEGTLDRIECARSGSVTLHVRDASTMRRFSADGLAEIEWLTYGDDRRDPVRCGARTPADLVYVTWRPLTPATKGVTGQVVALEFLPDRDR
ncbi:MAG TPA: hypothetical protein VNJ03_01250 [Vicinamibacterales bacterium]|nr:hypothetical protein [Vicinamibacterales bacterium]